MSLERLNALQSAMVQAEKARAKRFALYESYRKGKTTELVAEWSKDVRDRAKTEGRERSGDAERREEDDGLQPQAGGSRPESDGSGSGDGEQRRDDSGGRDDQPNIR